jgi:hypothetical protein
MMWEFRYYELDAQGERQRRTATVGSLADYPTESAVRKSPEVQPCFFGSIPKRLNLGRRL